MDIVKRGRLPSERQHTGKCRHCDTEVRFRQGEAREHYSPREGGYLEVECPVCGKPIFVTLPRQMYWTK